MRFPSPVSAERVRKPLTRYTMPLIDTNFKSILQRTAEKMLPSPKDLLSNCYLAFHHGPERINCFNIWNEDNPKALRKTR